MLAKQYLHMKYIPVCHDSLELVSMNFEDKYVIPVINGVNITWVNRK